MPNEGEIHYTLGNAITRNRQEGWTYTPTILDIQT